MKKGEYNFVLIFAVFAGVAILILAIYGANKAGENIRYGSDTQIAKDLAIITDPLQAGFAEGSYGKILFNQETRINNFCFEDDSEFGSNRISVSTKSEIGKTWTNPGSEIRVPNKYLFSKEVVQGKEFYVFSKPFDFPYKVSDMIFIISDEYCFIGAPKEIVDEVKGISKIKTANCSSEMVQVCFGSGNNCDMKVGGYCVSGCKSKYDFGVVETQNGDMDFSGNLMYAAIFSEKSVYDCNVERLLNRASKIAEIFSEKADLMDARKCNTNLNSELLAWAMATRNSKSGDLASLSALAKKLEDKKSGELCAIWE